MAKQFIKQSGNPTNQIGGGKGAGSHPATANRVSSINRTVADMRKRKARNQRAANRAGGGGGSH